MRVERFTEADADAPHENNVCTICREDCFKFSIDHGFGRPVFSNFPVASWKVYYSKGSFAVSCDSHLVDELNFDNAPVK